MTMTKIEGALTALIKDEEMSVTEAVVIIKALTHINLEKPSTFTKLQLQAVDELMTPPSLPDIIGMALDKMNHPRRS
jgi:hypothetical protein